MTTGIKDQAFFTRDHRLQERGYPIKASSFSKLCLPSRNAGPPVAKFFGKRPLYRLEDAIAWAESKCRPSGCIAA
jgi:hypothetical protein